MAFSEKGKFAEGLEYVRQAEKSLKTSFFKWRPDFEGAAMDYTNAATCFKNAKALTQCKDALLKASDCYRQHHSLFSSAKSLEQAALIAKEMGDMEETVRLIERACILFQEHGAPDSAALSYEKGAKMVETKLPAKAASLYLKASEVVQLEDRPRQVADYLGKAARLMVKIKMYDEAADVIAKEMEMHISGENRPAVGRLAIALVLIHLKRGDLIAAQKAFQRGLSLIEEDELQTIETLLEAFDQEDSEMAARALSSPFLMHMDVEYAKLARNLDIPSNVSEIARSRTSELRSSVGSMESSSSSATAKASAANPSVGDIASELQKTRLDLPEGNGERLQTTNVEKGKGTDASDDEYSGGLC